MTKVAIYKRVSTLEQVEGYSLSEQEDRARKFCESKDWEVADVYEDDGYSGSSLDRPEIQRLMVDCEKDKFDTVLVYKLDRLSRSQKDTLYLIEEVFQKNDVSFISMTESFDTSTPFGVAVLGILSVFAQLERENIKERMSSGRVARAKDGYWHGGGSHPFGYDYVDGELIVNEEEKIIVQRVFDLYLSGETTHKIAKILNKEYPFRHFYQTHIKRILENDLNIGLVEFNGEKFKGKHEPIVSDEVFYKAQEERRARNEKRKYSNSRKGLLVGKIYCKPCGFRYYRKVYSVKDKSYVYYKCKSKESSFFENPELPPPPKCDNKIWREEELDNLVLDYLKSLDFSAHEVKQQNELANIESKEKQIRKLDGQLDRIKDLYIMGLALKSEVEEKSKSLQARKSELEEEIIKIKSKPDQSEMIETLENFDWEKASNKDLMILVDTLIDRIELDGEKVDIYLTF